MAGWCWSDGNGVLAGWSAAAVLGSRWIPTRSPSVVVVGARQVKPNPMLMAWHWHLDPREVVSVDGVLVTTPARTAYDLGRRLPLLEAVTAIDELCWIGCTEPTTVLRSAELHPGARGLVALRRAVALADPGAESPWETRTRLALVMGGLPRPETQIEVFDGCGKFVGRVDLGWRRWRVAVEYDGAHHRDPAQFAQDLRRHNRLTAAGWTAIRVTAADVLRPDDLLAQVKVALARAGASW